MELTASMLGVPLRHMPNHAWPLPPQISLDFFIEACKLEIQVQGGMLQPAGIMEHTHYATALLQRHSQYHSKHALAAQARAHAHMP